MGSLRTFLLACGVALAVSPAFALDTPVGGSSDRRIRFVDYTPNDVVKVVGRFRASTQIEFAPAKKSRMWLSAIAWHGK